MFDRIKTKYQLQENYKYQIPEDFKDRTID